MSGSSVKPDKSFKVLIIGPGALGTFFFTKLNNCGNKVHIWGNPEHITKALKVQLTLIENDKRITRNTYINPTPQDLNTENKFDIVLVCVKAYSLEKIKKSLQYLHSNYFVFPQNGTGFEEAIFSNLKGKPVRAVVTYGLHKEGQWITRVAGKGRVYIQEDFSELAEIMQNCGIEIQTVYDINPLVMQKLIVNAVINPLTAILRVKNGDLIRIPILRELVKQVVVESTKVLNTKGNNFNLSEIEQVVFEVIEKTRHNISSMLQDILSGRPTEIDYINGAIIKIANEQKMNAPINLALYKLVKAIETLNLA